MTLEARDFGTDVEIAWCPGCGNFPILTAVKQTLAGLGIPPHRLLLCSGIGQAPKLPHYVKANCFNGLHGRELAAATGAKLAASDLTVIVHAGDGGALGEGGNHLLGAIRRNVDLTLVIHDNRTYGLTKGQASPTTELGAPAPLQPEGLAIRPVNPLALALVLGCSFVAQGSAAHPDDLVGILTEAVRHRGFSLVNVLQPCVTWDRVHTYAYYREHCRPVPAGHDPADRWAALRLALEPPEGLPVGILYRDDAPTYEDRVLAGRPHPLRELPLAPERAEALLDRYA